MSLLNVTCELVLLISCGAFFKHAKGYAPIDTTRIQPAGQQVKYLARAGSFKIRDKTSDCFRR